jgi:hypothetical protein
LSAPLESDRSTAAHHLTVDLEPVIFVLGNQLPHAVADGIVQAGLPLAARIDLHEAVIERMFFVVEEHLDDAKTLVDGLEECLVLRVNVPRLGHLLLAPDRYASLGLANFGRKIRAVMPAAGCSPP